MTWGWRRPEWWRVAGMAACALVLWHDGLGADWRIGAACLFIAFFLRIERAR